MKHNATSTKQSPGATALLVSFGVTLVLLSGVVYGHYSRRWGTPPDLAAAAKRLESFPTEIGDWRSQSDHELSNSVQQMLECAGYVSRTYVNLKTGNAVTMAVLVGPPGPIAVHTPEICYSSRDYSIDGQREAIRFADGDSPPDYFWNTQFQTRDVFADRLSVYYAWSDGDKWIASRSPRFEFAASPCLYKIQLAGTVSKQADPKQDDPPTQFIHALLKSGWKPDGA